MTVAASSSAFVASAHLKVGELGVEPVDGVADIEAKIGRHLIVARARRMQSSGGGSDQLGEPRFDIHVNVFELAREDKIARRDLSLDPGQAIANLGRVRVGDNAAMFEHRDMGQRRRYILGPESLVEVDGDVDRLQHGGGCVLKAAAPYFARHMIPSETPIFWNP